MDAPEYSKYTSNLLPPTPELSLSRTPSVRNRPPLPHGPRSSTRAFHGVDILRTSRSYTAPPSSGWTTAGDTSLSVITENLHPAPLPAPPKSSQPSTLSGSPSGTPSRTPSATPPNSAVKSVSKANTLIPPPKLSFDSQSIPWKGLSLDAAQWTFTSQELQIIVSRAIRLSARESFIRLLSVDTIDRDLPAELERLGQLKAVTQSKYRFNVQRRTMLLQALNSFATAPSDKNSVGVVGQLTTQLSEITADCDRILEELLRISDQQAQIEKLLEAHWASSLAVALRKLNGSYARRTSELVAAKDRVAELESELEEAWQEAERMAREMDDFDNVDSDDDEGEAIIERAEIHFIPSVESPVVGTFDPIAGLVPEQQRSPAFEMTNPSMEDLPSSEQETDDVLDFYTDEQAVMDIAPEPEPELPSIPSEHIEEAEAPERSDPKAAETDLPDNASITSSRSRHSTHSVRSTCSKRSTRSAAGRSIRSVRTTRSVVSNSSGQARSRRVTAARKRSQRTSQASLRFPKEGRSSSQVRKPAVVDDLAPPVPSLRKALTLRGDSTSFLSFGSNHRQSQLEDVPRRASTALGFTTNSTVNGSRGSSLSSATRRSTAASIRKAETGWKTEHIGSDLKRSNSTKTSNPYTKLRTLTKRCSAPFLSRFGSNSNASVP